MPLLRPRVVTRWDVDALASKPPSDVKEDEYLAKLIKYIPGEIVAMYLSMFGALKTLQSPWAPWLSLAWVGVLAILAALWIPYATSDKDRGIPPHPFQTWSAVAAFLVWTFALGGAWVSLLPNELAAVQPVIGSMAVAVTTLVVPLLEKMFALRRPAPAVAGV